MPAMAQNTDAPRGVIRNHLPPTLRRGAAAASLGAAQGAGIGAGASGAGGAPAGGAGGRGGRGAAQGSFKRENLRVRNLLVRGKACRSEMGVAQKNINFGKIAVRACSGDFCSGRLMGKGARFSAGEDGGGVLVVVHVVVVRRLISHLSLYGTPKERSTPTRGQGKRVARVAFL